MQWKNQIKTLAPYKPGKSSDEVKKEYGLDRIVKLASNENPFGYSQQIDEWFRENGVNHAIYPDGYATGLRGKLAAFYELEPEQFILGNGSDEVILMISRALLKEGKNTVMATPTFPQYRHNAVVEGAEYREVPLVDGAHDLEEMLKQINDDTAVVWVCSPNNPTGVYVDELKLKNFLDQVPSDVLVVLDEAYYEYVDAPDYYDARALIAQYGNLIVTRTFSKAYGLAGFRVGYGMAQSALIQAIEPVREPFNTNVLAQVSATIALDDQEFIRSCKEENKKGLEQYYTFCKELGLHYYPSQGNFILIDFKRNADGLFQALLEKGYIVRSGQALGFPTSLRITVGSFEQNEGIIAALKEILTSQKV